jgi:hypothetical protein
MINWLKYLVVGLVLVSLGGCFIPVGGGGGYYRGGGGDDDSYQTLNTAPQAIKADWPQVYQGYAAPRYYNNPDERNYAYRGEGRGGYFQRGGRYDRQPREEEHRRREDDDN